MTQFHFPENDKIQRRLKITSTTDDDVLWVNIYTYLCIDRSIDQINAVDSKIKAHFYREIQIWERFGLLVFVAYQPL